MSRRIWKPETIVQRVAENAEAELLKFMKRHGWPLTSYRTGKYLSNVAELLIERSEAEFGLSHKTENSLTEN